MAAAAVQGTTATGPRPGLRTRRCGEALDHAGAGPLPRCHATQDGFDLEAGVRVRADQRDRLERLCRYVLRPPLADERLRILEDGDVLLAFERRWSDGTTHLRFSPVELLERLAVLMRRSYGLDVLACPRCGPSTGSGPPRAASRGGGRLRLVALIDERSVIERILGHLRFPTELPAMRPGRPPPLLDEGAAP
jgi:hypothetical protein